MATPTTVTPIVSIESAKTKNRKKNTMHKHTTAKKATAKKATGAKKATEKTSAKNIKGMPLGKFETRKDQLVALAKKGITRDAVMKLTGWDATKSVRGFFSTLKTIHRESYDVTTSLNKKGETVYVVREK